MKQYFVAMMMMLAGVLVLCGCGESKPRTVDASVIAHLQAAYNGESNASAKYAMYAKGAEAAGAKSVAALFRATAKSESLHAARQAKVLKSFGVEPKAEIKLPKFVSVDAALQDGIKGETYEIMTMYPEFLANAKAKKAPAEVLEAFKYALEAEKEHAKYYQQAAAKPAEWLTAGKTFYVCTVCGYTTNSPIKVCLLCAAPGEKFEVFR